jgi:Helicase associated domain/Helicase conserved C-terminal domain
VALLHACREYGARRTISFHSSIRGARRFPAILDYLARTGAAGVKQDDISARVVVGDMPASQRVQILRELAQSQDSVNVVCNARCLSEGIDVPALDSIAFVDPRHSQIDIIQAVGRVIRRHDDKRVGRIIIPVPLTSAAAHGELERSDYRAVYRVLRALRAHDETLAAELDRASAATGREARLPGRIRIDTSLLVDPDSFLRAFKPILLEETSVEWEVWYTQLCRWVDEHGAAALTNRRSGKPENLRRWITKQRSLWSAGQLSPDRSARLETVPGWVWNPNGWEWEQNLQAVAGFQAAHGRLPNNRDDIFDGRPVGRWLTKQGAHARDGSLNDDRIERLRALPGWSATRRDDKFWRAHAAYQIWSRDRNGTELLACRRRARLVPRECPRHGPCATR